MRTSIRSTIKKFGKKAEQNAKLTVQKRTDKEV